MLPSFKTKNKSTDNKRQVFVNNHANQMLPAQLTAHQQQLLGAIGAPLAPMVPLPPFLATPVPHPLMFPTNYMVSKTLPRNFLQHQAAAAAAYQAQLDLISARPETIKQRHLVKPSLNIDQQMAVAGVRGSPLCRCRVMYLGSRVPHVTKNGLHGIQAPLRDLYPEDKFISNLSSSHPSSSTNKTEKQTHPNQPATIDISHLTAGLGIDSWLSVWSNGLLLENYDEFGRETKHFFSIETLHYCAAVRYFNTSNLPGLDHQDRNSIRFLPLDAPLFQHIAFASSDSSTYASMLAHPPVFAAIMRRTSGIKVLECHAFICRRDAAANALVRCCLHSYSDVLRARTLNLNYAKNGHHLAPSASAGQALMQPFGTKKQYHTQRIDFDPITPPPTFIMSENEYETMRKRQTNASTIHQRRANIVSAQVKATKASNNENDENAYASLNNDLNNNKIDNEFEEGEKLSRLTIEDKLSISDLNNQKKNENSAFLSDNFRPISQIQAQIENSESETLTTNSQKLKHSKICKDIDSELLIKQRSKSLAGDNELIDSYNQQTNNRQGNNKTCRASNSEFVASSKRYSRSLQQLPLKNLMGSNMSIRSKNRKNNHSGSNSHCRKSASFQDIVLSQIKDTNKASKQQSSSNETNFPLTRRHSGHSLKIKNLNEFGDGKQSLCRVKNKEKIYNDYYNYSNNDNYATLASTTPLSASGTTRRKSDVVSIQRGQQRVDNHENEVNGAKRSKRNSIQTKWVPPMTTMNNRYSINEQIVPLSNLNANRFSNQYHHHLLQAYQAQQFSVPLPVAMQMQQLDANGKPTQVFSPSIYANNYDAPYQDRQPPQLYFPNNNHLLDAQDFSTQLFLQQQQDHNQQQSLLSPTAAAYYQLANANASLNQELSSKNNSIQVPTIVSGSKSLRSRKATSKLNVLALAKNTLRSLSPPSLSMLSPNSNKLHQQRSSLQIFTQSDVPGSHPDGKQVKTVSGAKQRPPIPVSLSECLQMAPENKSEDDNGNHSSTNKYDNDDGSIHINEILSGIPSFVAAKQQQNSYKSNTNGGTKRKSWLKRISLVIGGQKTTNKNSSNPLVKSSCQVNHNSVIENLNNRANLVADDAKIDMQATSVKQNQQDIEVIGPQQQQQMQDKSDMSAQPDENSGNQG